MRPASIANYLDHLGQDRPDREFAQTRELAVPAPQPAQSPEARSRGPRRLWPWRERSRKPERNSPIAGRRRPWAAGLRPRRTPSSRSSRAKRPRPRRWPRGSRKPTSAGAEEGRREAQGKLEELRTADGAAAQELVEAERIAFQLNQYAQLEGAIRAGFAEIGENIGAAVARILAPFLAGEVVKHATDELCKNVARLCAGRSSGLITIRGPERLLSRLRQRMPDLPADVEYVEDNGVEAVVEANPTQIVTELRPWADLLASLDP